MIEIDALGKKCPMPVIELARCIGDVPVGGIIAVLSDDDAAAVDIPAWCRMRGHEFIRSQDREQGRAYIVRRA